MLLIFVGDDRALIERKIKHVIQTNGFDTYQTVENPSEAYLTCLSRGLTETKTATVLESEQKGLKLNLKMIPRILKSQNLLIIICPSWSSKTKLGQVLKPYLDESKLPGNWDKKDIDKGIEFYGSQYGLSLSSEIQNYLRTALNNDFVSLNSGLSTIALLTDCPSLDLVRSIIPSEYATAIELKELILHKKRSEIPGCVAKLEGVVPPQVIMASLSTQFTLLMQAAIGISQGLKDRDIAKLANIKNVNRLYYIAQDVKLVSIEQFVWINQTIKESQIQLQYGSCDLSAKLMLLSCY